MPRNRDPVVFTAWLLVLSTGLGWLSWTAAASMTNPANLMWATPVISAMLAARGFSLRRKLMYVSATLGVYVLAPVLYRLLGLDELVTRQLTASQSLPPVVVLAYVVFVTAFPIAMLVLFVGRTPTLLWSRKAD